MENLPVELILQTLRLLKDQDLRNLAYTCRRIYKIWNEHLAIWRFKYHTNQDETPRIWLHRRQQHGCVFNSASNRAVRLRIFNSVNEVDTYLRIPNTYASLQHLELGIWVHSWAPFWAACQWLGRIYAPKLRSLKILLTGYSQFQLTLEESKGAAWDAETLTMMHYPSCFTKLDQLSLNLQLPESVCHELLKRWFRAPNQIRRLEVIDPSYAHFERLGYLSHLTYVHLANLRETWTVPHTTCGPLLSVKHLTLKAGNAPLSLGRLLPGWMATHDKILKIMPNLVQIEYYGYILDHRNASGFVHNLVNLNLPENIEKFTFIGHPHIAEIETSRAMPQRSLWRSLAGVNGLERIYASGAAWQSVVYRSRPCFKNEVCGIERDDWARIHQRYKDKFPHLDMRVEIICPALDFRSRKGKAMVSFKLHVFKASFFSNTPSTLMVQDLPSLGVSENHTFI